MVSNLILLSKKLESILVSRLNTWNSWTFYSFLLLDTISSLFSKLLVLANKEVSFLMIISLLQNNSMKPHYRHMFIVLSMISVGKFLIVCLTLFENASKLSWVISLAMASSPSFFLTKWETFSIGLISGDHGGIKNILQPTWSIALFWNSDWDLHLVLKVSPLGWHSVQTFEGLLKISKKTVHSYFLSTAHSKSHPYCMLQPQQSLPHGHHSLPFSPCLYTFVIDPHLVSSTTWFLLNGPHLWGSLYAQSQPYQDKSRCPLSRSHVWAS